MSDQQIPPSVFNDQTESNFTRFYRQKRLAHDCTQTEHTESEEISNKKHAVLAACFLKLGLFRLIAFSEMYHILFTLWVPYKNRRCCTLIVVVRMFQYGNIAGGLE